MFNDVDFSFLHCRHFDFVTAPCCFQAPRILCLGTRPPSSRLLFQFFLRFFFFFRSTDPKSENAFDNKRKKKGMAQTVKKKEVLIVLPFLGCHSKHLTKQLRSMVFSTSKWFFRTPEESSLFPSQG